MIKVIIPVLLALLLMACSVNQTMQCDTTRCKMDTCMLEQKNTLQQLDNQLLASFNANLPACREEIYYAIKDLDAQRQILAKYLDTPGLLHPDTEFLRHLVSDEQLVAWRNLPLMEYKDQLDELRNLIPDWEKFREKCCLTGIK